MPDLLPRMEAVLRRNDQGPVSPTNLHCATCARPLPDAPAEHHIGAIRYCSADCVTRWYCLPQHDRRRVLRRDFGIERRTP